MTFDAREIKLLQPGEHLTSPDYPGLRIEATATRRTWVYRYRSPVDGRLRQIKIGSWPGTSMHAAIAAWEDLRARRDAGEDPAEDAKSKRLEKRAAAAAKKRTAAIGTVRQVALDYLDGHIDKVRAPKGAAEVRRMLTTMLGDVATVLAADLTRAQAFDLIKGVAETAPVQAAKLRAELGAAWDYAIDAGRLPDDTPNWWRQILRGRIRSKGKHLAGKPVGTAKRVLSPEEVGTLLRWLPNFTALVEDALVLYLWTATRGAEILGMRGSEISIENGQTWWTVPKARTKSARHASATDLRVPLFGRALAVVERRQQLYGEGLLFPSRTGKSVDQKVIGIAVWNHQPYCTSRPEVVRPRLPVTHWAPHDLRRTSRTLLALLGCPDAVGEAILGHMLPGVMGTYNRHAYDAERVEWLSRLSSYLDLF
ncbi:MAG: alpha/beta hydrolase [Candidatus Dactylopiibacterium carminicum]|uniref:Alpha/beta hydrolase n=1 Tax=Candidatus Dactylopiibacterium carminicum TaxID=857335 RepID=A0A272EP40_9RHOO|nr:integrase arm-type DNA-binding domain-containing protein [Candidatus Dactylopiibacterium carminicum]KAF7598230.1 alpha/beta hydrolase [Candidatus Dactylopiibacterium carminicum]PAS91884.1 MAG: alpha/beta hydrolase [Candidatus Dactylopiibacterium carminicum]PAS94877.1 MAG: alpha/beta hydrolase [Candidatus Dactylopiibacterium carminicum]PAS97072.1 MAG: alpha/beta hydrolase [Candidatus Dactylopiibacterium carminicum]